MIKRYEIRPLRDGLKALYKVEGHISTHISQVTKDEALLKRLKERHEAADQEITRECMCCGKEFTSFGIVNRMCKFCTERRMGVAL